MEVELEPLSASGISQPVENLNVTDEQITEDENIQQLPFRQFLTVFIICGLAAFCSGFETNCIATIVPVLSDEFHSSRGIGWYAMSYLAASSAVVLFFGKVYSSYPTKQVFCLSTIILAIGCTVCSRAESSATIIAGRAITGLGNAGIFPGINIVLSKVTPLRTRQVWLGTLGGIECSAIALAPLLAGVLTDSFTWRACFYICMAIGFTIAMGVVIFFPSLERNTVAESQAGSPNGWEKILKLDLVGAGISLAGLFSLVLFTQWGGVTYEWSNYRVITPLVVFVVSLVSFTLWQGYLKDNATLPPRILKKRSVLFGGLFSFFTSGCLNLLAYYLPLWFQTVQKCSPYESGLMSLPLSITLAISALLAGCMNSYIGFYTPGMLASVVFTSISAGLFTTIDANTTSGHWIAYQILLGIGSGLGWQGPFMAVQTVLSDQKDVAIGLVFIGFAITLGGATTLTVAQNVFLSQLPREINQSLPGLSPKEIADKGLVSLLKAVPPKDLDKVIEAYNSVFVLVFYCGLASSCAAAIGALGTEWKSTKKIRTD